MIFYNSEIDNQKYYLKYEMKSAMKLVRMQTILH